MSLFRCPFVTAGFEYVKSQLTTASFQYSVPSTHSLGPANENFFKNLRAPSHERQQNRHSCATPNALHHKGAPKRLLVHALSMYTDCSNTSKYLQGERGGGGTEGGALVFVYHSGWVVDHGTEGGGRVIWPKVMAYTHDYICTH